MTAFPDLSPDPSFDAASWSARYGERHRLERITDLPAGIVGPKKVRIYRRRDHFVLQHWDPREKTNRSHRVEGDLVAAIARAREIDQSLVFYRSSGTAPRRGLRHGDLVASFLVDLGRRADAGEIRPATVRRYRAALDHYLAYASEASVEKTHPGPTRVDRHFRLGLRAFLRDRPVAANGRAQASSRPMQAQEFVMQTVRALYEWAADPERGGLLGDAFRNPFLRSTGARPVHRGDPLAPPAVTLQVALDLVRAADRYQLRLFVPMLLYGLRAGEPVGLFREHLQEDWLVVPCIPELDLFTKGRRSKRLPLPPSLASFRRLLGGDRTTGLLYERRSPAEGGGTLGPLSLAEMIEEYRRRCGRCKAGTAGDRERIRRELFREAGALDYDRIDGEFRRLAARLGWPRSVTLKGMRHHFATAMLNAGLPESSRRYLLGHAPGKGAIEAYTHLHELPRQFAAALQGEWAPLQEAILRRVAEIESAAVPPAEEPRFP